MTTYYKATVESGRDFYSGTVDYAAALDTGRRVHAKTAAHHRGYRCCTEDVVHASDVPTETLIGGSWPCRLFEVTGRPVAQEGRKFGFRSLRVVRELDATLALGPQGVEVAALIQRARSLTADELDRLAAARGAAWAAAWAATWDAAWDAARAAAWDAAWDAARAAAWDAAWDATSDATSDAALGLVARDLITPAQYDQLTLSWRTVIGRIHPDDAEVAS